jgi:tetratricopeptide (TPR) repeat protein
VRGRPDEALRAYERAFGHAQQVGHRPWMMLGALAWCRFIGTTPVAELVAWLDDELEPGAGRDQFVRAYRGWSLAKLGRFDEARRIIAEARADQAERGGGALLANLTAFEAASVELLAGDPAAAAEFGLEGCRLHEELGEHQGGFLGGAAAALAKALYALDRLEEADSWAARSAELDPRLDLWAQMLWRQVRGKVLARRNERAEAQRLAGEAVTIGEGTEMLEAQADAYADLGEVLFLGGSRDEAAAALEQAVERYDRKGNLVMAQRARARLAEVMDAAPL